MGRDGSSLSYCVPSPSCLHQGTYRRGARPPLSLYFISPLPPSPSLSLSLSLSVSTAKRPADAQLLHSGYVALAVASPRKTYTREVETGLGGDREGNMVAFGKAALEFLRDVILEEEKEGEEGEARL